MTSLIRSFRVALLLVVAASLIAGAVSAQVLLDPVTHPKFVNPLPIPGRLDYTAGFRGALQMRETIQSYGLVDATGAPLLTTVWGYGNPDDGIPVTSPGPTIVAMRDMAVDIRWMNKLPMYNYPGGPAPHLLPLDVTLHMAHPMGRQGSGVPLVTHLHGGHTESASDGLPEQWFTQNWREMGPTFVKKTPAGTASCDSQNPRQLCKRFGQTHPLSLQASATRVTETI